MILDFAGGTVVHINSGIAGLVAAIVIGKRKSKVRPHNVALTMIGASMLWVGWFGFNAGSAVAANGSAGMAMLVTQVAAASAGIAWMLAEWFTGEKKPSLLGLCSGAVALNGVPPRTWRSVYGIMKAYETYSGFKTHFTEESPIFEKIQEVGQEFGATTGRKRQVRWLHLDGVIQALYINDVTHLIINKVDVLEQVNGFGVVFRGTTHRFHTSHEFQKFVEDTIRWHYRSDLHSITWSRTPEGV